MAPRPPGRGRGRGRTVLEPWYRLAEVSLKTPIKLWFNWRFEGLENVPPEGPALLACNHTSYFDPLAHALTVIQAGRRPRFLIKKELYGNWLLRHVFTGARQIPVDRGTGNAAPVDAAVQALREGEAVMIFPEGTVTRNPDHTPMHAKTGVARIALGADVPVIPMAVWGAHQIMQKGGQKGLTFGRPIWAKVGAPMDFSDFLDRREDPEALREVIDAVMAEVSRLVADLRSRYPKRWAER
ncbi:MAG: lysophospholipid acyltransferase family protein [Actinomycetota bacterium]